MNANYLAEGLETIASKNTDLDDQIRDYIMDAAYLLRQQQAEIEALHEEREGLCVFCENRGLSKKAQEK
jgi:hypothetical protein